MKWKSSQHCLEGQRRKQSVTQHPAPSLRKPHGDWPQSSEAPSGWGSVCAHGRGCVCQVRRSVKSAPPPELEPGSPLTAPTAPTALCALGSQPSPARLDVPERPSAKGHHDCRLASRSLGDVREIAAQPMWLVPSSGGCARACTQARPPPLLAAKLGPGQQRGPLLCDHHPPPGLPPSITHTHMLPPGSAAGTRPRQMPHSTAAPPTKGHPGAVTRRRPRVSRTGTQSELSPGQAKLLPALACSHSRHHAFSIRRVPWSSPSAPRPLPALLLRWPGHLGAQATCPPPRAVGVTVSGRPGASGQGRSAAPPRTCVGNNRRGGGV